MLLKMHDLTPMVAIEELGIQNTRNKFIYYFDYTKEKAPATICM